MRGGRTGRRVTRRVFWRHFIGIIVILGMLPVGADMANSPHPAILADGGLVGVIIIALHVDKVLSAVWKTRAWKK